MKKYLHKIIFIFILGFLFLGNINAGGEFTCQYVAKSSLSDGFYRGFRITFEHNGNKATVKTCKRLNKFGWYGSDAKLAEEEEDCNIVGDFPEIEVDYNSPSCPFVVNATPTGTGKYNMSFRSEVSSNPYDYENVNTADCVYTNTREKKYKYIKFIHNKIRGTKYIYAFNGVYTVTTNDNYVFGDINTAEKLKDLSESSLYNNPEYNHDLTTKTCPPSYPMIGVGYTSRLVNYTSGKEVNVASDITTNICPGYTNPTDCQNTQDTVSCVWVENESSPNEGFCNVDNLLYVGCGDASDIPMQVPALISFAVNLLKIATPIILIFISVITLLKALAAQKDDEIKKAQSSLVKKIIASVLVFFVIGIVQFVISKVASDEEYTGFTDCLNCFLNNKCETATYYKTVVSGDEYCTPLTTGKTDSCEALFGIESKTEETNTEEPNTEESTTNTKVINKGDSSYESKYDINNDGKIDESDSQYVFDVSTGIKEVNDKCDVNGDGIVTSTDALLIMKKLGS